MLQTAFENARDRQDNLLSKAVDEHRTDNLSDHRERVDHNLGNTSDRSQRCKRNSRDDVQRVLNRTGEHTERISQAEHDEAQQGHSTIHPVQPAHASRAH